MLRAATVLLAVALGWIYQIDPVICNGCGLCIPSCPEGAISMQGPDAAIDPGLCTGCGICEDHCPRGAIYKSWYSSAPDEILHTSQICPNPTAGVIQVSSPAEGVVSVFSVSGRLVERRSATSPATTIDLGGFGPGAYLVLVDDEPLGLVIVRR